MVVLFIVVSLFSSSVLAEDFWLEVEAENALERTELTQKGLHIVELREGSVVGLADSRLVDKLKRGGRVRFVMPLDLSPFLTGFPTSDSEYHSYQEMTDQLKGYQNQFVDQVELQSLGSTHEGREIWHLRISGDLSKSRPSMILMGGHHAREHLSVEMPIRLIDYLLSEYQAGNLRVVNVFENYEVHIIPMVNPDGAVHDIETGRYRYWRKNRRNNGAGQFGVDLNRNYGYQWGMGGSSKDPDSDTYMGPTPFSEPESQAIKQFIESRDNANIVVSLHSFSQLILYPWGYTDQKISQKRDLEVHKKMAEKMAQWNGYRAMQSSELYIASGDTTDWTYGALGKISFTFELDPKSIFFGGFYPGDEIIDEVFRKNLEPFLYLIEHSDNPYRVL